MAGTDFIVEDGVCKLKDRSAFAGSVATSDVLLRFLVRECDVTLTDAVKMLSENPAKMLGIKTGKIENGFFADLVMLDSDFNVTDVFVKGEKV